MTLQYNGKDLHVFPLFDDFSLSVTQQTDRPIEKLINIVKNAIASLAPNSTFNTIITSVQQYQQLMGTQFLGKGYYATAWTGSTPASLSLKVKAFRGMNGKWNAKDEVINPLNLIYSQSLPITSSGDSLQIEAPMPSGYDVLSNYGIKIAEQLIKKVTDFSTAANNLVNNIAGDLSTIINPDSAKSELNKLASKPNANSVLGINGISLSAPPINKVWNIDFGYFTGGSDVLNYVSFNSCVVESSTIVYSKEVEFNNGKVYPIKGEVTLSLKSESIITNVDFGQVV
jgi:hypothetical protein